MKRRTNQRRTYIAAIAILACFIGLSWLIYTKANLRSVLGGSTVRAILCDANSTPDVTIAEPEGDIVVDEALIVVKGYAVQTTELALFVNDTYSHTVALDDDGPFQTTATLQKGNNTIRIDAHFSCNQSMTSYNIVLTYAPKAKPTPGKSVDTDIPSIVSGPVVANPTATPSDEQALSPIERIGQKLRILPSTGDAQTTQTYTLVDTTISWLLVAGTIIAIIAVFMPSALIGTSAIITGHRRLSVSAMTLETTRIVGAVVTLLLVYLLQLG